jgi:hypothetical protein
MQHKWMVLFTTVVLVSLLIAPDGIAQAQVDTQGATLSCPQYESSLLKDKSFWHSLPPECLQDFKTSSFEANRSAQNIQPMTTGGPDGFGYTYDDTISYSWISASTNSGLTGDDEFAGPINIGFNFPFYGMPQTQLYFSTNGLITFGAGNWDWSGSDIPNDMNPNNLIAPFWDDLRVGNPYNTGAIYYSQGGNAPNRYFVVEWRNVEYWDNTENISFEAILHENGDIVFQYQSLPSSYWPVVAIEDSVGYDGLPYSIYSNVPLNDIRFTYPVPAARVLVSPAERAGGFAPTGGHKDFNLTISNSGTLGTDTYDLTITSNWSVTFYASNGITPLTDTDTDGVIDTGPLPQGTSTTVIARFSTPGGAQVGDNTTAVLYVTSSLNLSKTRTIVLRVSVPAGFANVFQDNADGSMSFMTVDSNQTNLSKVTTDNYFGYFPAVVSLPNGNYLYAWSKGSFNASNVWRDVEYVVLDRSRNIILPLTKLTNNSSTTIYTEDYLPSFAVAPNGTIGAVWYRYLENPSTNDANYNLYFATISSSGSLLTGPTNITNNTTWGPRNEVPRFYSPTIAASDDNRFIIGWEYRRPGTMGGDVNDIWYAIRSSTGTSIFPPTALTIYGWSWEPILNSLTGGKVIMTWGEDTGGPYYAVIDSNGVISTPKTSLLGYGDVYYTPDAVQLPNGKVALAWTSLKPYSESDSGVELAILDSSYNLLGDSTFATSSWDTMSECISVTTDASSHVIMTWTGPNNWLLYALGNDTGTFVTEPMIYKTSGNYIDISCNGQGNAPYKEGDPIDVTIGEIFMDRYSLAPSESQRVSYKGVNSGPVQIKSQNAVAAMAAERVIYNVNGLPTSFSEMMALPDSQVDNTYWMPWYNNVDLDTQLRFGNVSNTPAEVHVWIGGQEKTSGCTSTPSNVPYPYILAAGASLRVSCPGVNNGPVKIDSNVNIVAAERVIYKVNNLPTSFSEMMGLPDSQLDNTYWMPWYNNVDLDTQLRFGNVSDTPAEVHVWIGGQEKTRGCTTTPSNVPYPYVLAVGASLRVNCPGVNDGPVQIISDVNIVAAERVIYKVNNLPTSFTEMMALPDSQLNTTYWMPWYNNVDLDTQLRFGNVSETNATATVRLYIGGQEMTSGCLPSNSLYTLAAGASLRVSCAGVSNGPVQIVSDIPIVAAERVIYNVNNLPTSFSEMMALPNSQLDNTYWLPWYNNVDLDTQLRFGVP